MCQDSPVTTVFHSNDTPQTAQLMNKWRSSKHKINIRSLESTAAVGMLCTLTVPPAKSRIPERHACKQISVATTAPNVGSYSSKTRTSPSAGNTKGVRVSPSSAIEELSAADPGLPHARSVNTRNKKGAPSGFILRVCSLQITGVEQRDDNKRSIGDTGRDRLPSDSRHTTDWRRW